MWSQASFVPYFRLAISTTRTLMRPASCAWMTARVRARGRFAEISTTFLGRAGACSCAHEIRHSPDEIAEPNRGERRSLSVRWRTARKLGTAGRAASEASDETSRRNLPTGTHLLLSLAQRRPTSRRCAFWGSPSRVTRARPIPACQTEPNRRTTSSTFARELNALIRK